MFNSYYRRFYGWYMDDLLVKSGYYAHIPVNMPGGAITGPILDQCWQQRSRTDPVLAITGMFTGM